MRANESIMMPESAKAVMRLLDDAGFECFVVGGYLRDSLLGRPTSDIDLATSATPEDVMRSLSHYSVIPTGLQHGTVTVLTDDGPIEITTFREDGSYSDHRHPDEVQFAKTIEEDLSRRDFTINALAWNEKRGLIDPWDGQSDLQRRVIRTVGDAHQRFREDALRIFRGLRLSAELAFAIEDETGEAMCNCKHLLQFVAPERLQVELNRLLVGEDALSVMQKHTGVFQTVIPEFEGIDESRRFPGRECIPLPELLEVAFMRMSYVSADQPLLPEHDDPKSSRIVKSNTKESIALRLAALLCDLDHATDVLKRLRYDSATIDRVGKLIAFQNEELCPDKRSVWRAIRAHGQEVFLDGMRLRIAGECALARCGEVSADSVAEAIGASVTLERKRGKVSAETDVVVSDSTTVAGVVPDRPRDTEKLQSERNFSGLSQTAAIARIAYELIREGRILDLKDLAVDGHDLLAYGYKGKEIGQALERILELVCVEGITNTRESLLGWIDDKRDKPFLHA